MKLVNETLDDVDAMLWKEIKRADTQIQTDNTLAMARLFDRVREEFLWNLSAKVNKDAA